MEKSKQIQTDEFTKGDLAEATANCVTIVKQELKLSKRGKPYTRNPLWLLQKAPPNLKPFIDHDYVNKLTREELQWLAEFDDAYYTGAKNAVSASWSQQEMRDAYGRNNRRLRDFNAKRWPVFLEDMDEKGEELV